MSTQTMHLSHPLKLWERIELVVGDGPEAGRYMARVENMTDKHVVITDPEFVGGRTLLREDMDVNVYVTREDAIYQFSSSIRRTTESGRQYVVLTLPRAFERVQRRSFVRVELSKQLHWVCVPLQADSRSKVDELAWNRSKTIDISAGGLLFGISERLEMGIPLLLRIDFFAELGVPDILCGVTRRITRRDQELVCGTEFILADQLTRHFTSAQLRALPQVIRHFDRNAQNRLATHVFQTQVALRQKGLL